MNSTRLFAFIILLGLFFSCTDEVITDPFISIDTEIDASVSQDQRIERLLQGEQEVTTDLLIRVTDLIGNPLRDAEVMIGDSKKMTDRNGFVIYDDISLRPNFNGLKVFKKGYLEGIRSLNIVSEDTYITIALIQKSVSADFYATAGGKVTVGDLSFEFDPESIVDKNGELYEGIVSLSAYHFDPSAPNINDIVPGQFVGLTPEDVVAPLGTFGMVQVEMTGSQGRELEIRDGHEVSISMPTLSDAPERIPIWNLNEKYGIWVEESEAQKVNNAYQFKVSHFSAYNCDVIIEEPCTYSYGSIISFVDIYGNPVVDNIELYFNLSEFNDVIFPGGSRTPDPNGSIWVFNCDYNSYSFRTASCPTLMGPYEIGPGEKKVELTEVTNQIELNVEITDCSDNLRGRRVYGAISSGSKTISFRGNIDDKMSLMVNSCYDIGQLTNDSNMSATIIDGENIYYMEDIPVVVNNGRLSASFDVCSPSIASDEFIIPIKDSKFKTELLRQLGVDEISFGLAKTVDQVIVSDGEIGSLQGIEYFTNLKSMIASNVNTSDIIGELQSNQFLDQIWLAGVNLNAIDGINNFENLSNLRITDTNLENAEELAELTKLKILDLSHNKIRSLHTPFKSTSIETLKLSNNKLTSIAGLSSLTLITELDINNNELNNLAGLQNMSGLLFLNLESNTIRNISDIAHLTQLRELDLHSSDLEHYNDLRELTSLEVLKLSGSLDEAEKLASLVNLKQLIMNQSGDGNLEMPNLDWVKPLKELEFLQIFGKTIGDISGVANLERIEWLSLSKNGIQDIPNLSNMINLRSLYLSSNDISDVEEFKKMTQLSFLDLKNNPISSDDIEELQRSLPDVTIWF